MGRAAAEVRLLVRVDNQVTCPDLGLCSLLAKRKFDPLDTLTRHLLLTNDY